MFLLWNLGAVFGNVEASCQIVGNILLSLQLPFPSMGNSRPSTFPEIHILREFVKTTKQIRYILISFHCCHLFSPPSPLILHFG